MLINTVLCLFLSVLVRVAGVAKLVDAPDLGSGKETCGGSNPSARTKLKTAKTQSLHSNKPSTKLFSKSTSKQPQQPQTPRPIQP